MTKWTYYPAVLALGFGISLSQAAKMTNAAPPADARFAREAAMGGMAEVELGRLALKNASDKDVKDFAQKMIDDHTKAGDDLKGVAAKKNLTLPSTVSPKDKALMTRLSKKTGADFDKAYMTAMVQDHEKDVADFQKEADSGQDSDLKEFASRTLPTLQDHMKMAKTTSAKVGGVSQ